MSIAKNIANFPVTNGYLLSLSKKLKLPVKDVVPCDFLPLIKLRKNQCVIVNLDPSHRPGSHYIVLWNEGNNKYFYFDSLGLPCTNTDILSYINTSRAKARNNFRYMGELVYSDKVIQAPLSFFCGFFCIAYIASRKLKMSLNDFYDIFLQFPYEIEKNDNLVIDFITEYLNETKRKK